MNRIALLPAYEPELILEDLVNELFEKGFQIVLVDDGSGPLYRKFFREMEPFAKVISYEENHGKGYALKLGLKYIGEHYSNATVVTMDADGQHLVEDAIKLCQKVEEDKNALWIGSRVIKKDAPTKSRLGNGITRFVYRTITGVKVYDTQSGLRAFSTDYIPEMLAIPGNRYEYEMNVLLQMAKKKQNMKEMPIETIYFDKQNSVSHFNAWSDSIKIYGEILKFAGSSLTCFLVDFLFYSLILTAMGNASKALLCANFGARAISSILNFMLNKKLVFNTQGNFLEESLKYFGLVLFNICANSLILIGLTHIGLNAFAAKILVEFLMFFFSYAMQHFVIFKKGAKMQLC